MPAQSLIQSSLLHLDTVKLGRLVLNAKHPQQEYYDPPLDSPAEFTVKPQSNFHRTLSSSRNSQLRSRLTALLLVSYSRRGADAVSLSAAHAQTYTLLNSGAWFRRACALTETRLWFEAAIADAKPVYLVVGYHTITDAHVTGSVSSDGAASGGLDVPALAVVPGGGGAARSDLLDARVNSICDVSRRSEKSFSAPGEQIYAVQYRKVEFKWYSSRSIDKGTLERDNRWKIFWNTDIRGEPVVEEEEEEDDDDVLEAETTDRLDCRFQESYSSEDGMDEFVF